MVKYFLFFTLVVFSILTIIIGIKKTKYKEAGIISVLSIGCAVALFYYFPEDKKEELIVAISPDYAPYAYTENGRIKGIDVEILEQIAKETKKKLVLKPMSYQFLFSSLKKSGVHLSAGGLSSNAQREKHLLKDEIYFSIPYAPAITGIGVKKNLIIREHFQGTIGIQTGSVFINIIKDKFPNANIVLREDFNMIVDEFKNNKIDMIVSDAIILIEIFNKKQKDYKIYKIKSNNFYSTYSKGICFAINTKVVDITEFNTLLMKIKSKIDKKIKALDKIPTI